MPEPRYYNAITELIGNTPLIRLRGLEEQLPARLFAKLEMFNPMSSIKDRIALRMIDDAEAAGHLRRGVPATIVEPTSGNTGIGLAMIARIRGYKLIVVMPDSVSMERAAILEALGAEVVQTPAEEGFALVMSTAEAIVTRTPDAWMPKQFENSGNPGAHADTTGQEIWRDLAGDVDIFVTGIGTGGTLSGTGRALKKHNPRVHIVAVEPANCALLSGGEPGRHRVQGLNAGFIAETTDTDIIDEVLTVSDEEAVNCARILYAKEGIFGGISSGASLHGLLTLAGRREHEGKSIVTIFPDSGERYLSTPWWKS
jgi:cysteine synthase A